MSLRLLFLISTYLLNCVNSPCYGQGIWKTNDIPKHLFVGSDAVIRNCTETITFNDKNSVQEEITKVITILNEDGLYHLQHLVNYKSSTEKVKIHSVVLYNSEGKKWKKIKKNEINDIASYDNISMVSDVRQKTISHRPTSYPVTIEYSYTLQRKNTLHLSVFSPVSYYNVSVEKYKFQFINKSSIQVDKKGYLLGEFHIEETTENTYIAKKIASIRQEDYSPNYSSLFPKVYYRPAEFNYEGHTGTFTSWEDYGNWINQSFLVKENNLKPHEIPQELQSIFNDEKSTLEKVKMVYQYIQNNTRYILINLEDGGLKPMKSGDVNTLKYGDCKALSFYMYSILKAANIPIKYGVVYAGTEHQYSMDESFPNPFQANHIIVNVPLEEENIWLDCTSNTNPFNFLGKFTDNRKVLLVDNNEITIEKTPDYGEELNKIEIKSSINLESNDIKLEKRNFGLKMSFPRYLSTIDDKKRNQHIKSSYFTTLASYDIKSYNTEEIADSLEYVESFSMKSDYVQEEYGEYILLTPGIYSFDIPSLKNTSNRNSPIEFVRSNIQQESLVYILDSAYELLDQEAETIIESEFGSYRQTVSMNKENLIITRKFNLNKNTYNPDKYQDIRRFFNEIRTLSDKKIIVKKL